MTDDVRRSGSTPIDTASGCDVTDRARASLEGLDPYVPWEVERFTDDSYGVYAAVTLWAKTHDRAVAEFIAEARSLMPELLAEVERLRGALDRVETVAEAWIRSTTWDGSPALADQAFGHALRGVLRGVP